MKIGVGPARTTWRRTSSATDSGAAVRTSPPARSSPQYTWAGCRPSAMAARSSRRLRARRAAWASARARPSSTSALASRSSPTVAPPGGPGPPPPASLMRRASSSRALSSPNHAACSGPWSNRPGGSSTRPASSPRRSSASRTRPKKPSALRSTLASAGSSPKSRDSRSPAPASRASRTTCPTRTVDTLAAKCSVATSSSWCASSKMIAMCSGRRRAPGAAARRARSAKYRWWLTMTRSALSAARRAPVTKQRSKYGQRAPMRASEVVVTSAHTGSSSPSQSTSARSPPVVRSAQSTSAAMVGVRPPAEATSASLRRHR